jgi:trans-2,3-dihydro-3-hydroxyanthranilate isomerase
MENAMKLTIVDVFAESRYEGNQLAVVEGAAGLPDRTMLAIAREMNFSETTFATEQCEGRARMRVFTPGEELPFAGHPTLGTAWVLGRHRDAFTLDMPVGAVTVTFRDDIAWLTPPRAELLVTLTPEHAAELVGASIDDLDTDLPPCVIRCGPTFPVIAVKSLDALRRVRVSPSTGARLRIPGFPFIVCRGGYSSDATFAARMLFFDGVAIREDPATGSANAAFAWYLRRRGERGHFIVEQGFEVKRPSRIYLEVDDALSVGGRVHAVAEGHLT